MIRGDKLVSRGNWAEDGGEHFLHRWKKVATREVIERDRKGDGRTQEMEEMKDQRHGNWKEMLPFFSTREAENGKQKAKYVGG